MSLDDLSRQAEQEKPAFDSALHGRIMRGVDQARIQRITTPPSRYRVFAGATALAAAVALGISTYQFNRAPAETPAQFVPLIASLRESTDSIHQQFAAPLESANHQITLLQEDAADFGRFVRQQFDVIPKDNRTLNKPS